MTITLNEHAVVLGAHADDWRDAVRLAGNALVYSDATTPAYTDRMISVVEDFGSYIVIAPGLALAHARPGPDVLADGISVVTLAEPIAFGHAHNDPVSVVLGLAVSSTENHLAKVAELANVFNDTDAIARLTVARNVDDVRQVFANN